MKTYNLPLSEEERDLLLLDLKMYRMVRDKIYKERLEQLSDTTRVLAELHERLEGVKPDETAE